MLSLESKQETSINTAPSFSKKKVASVLLATTAVCAATVMLTKKSSKSYPENNLVSKFLNLPKEASGTFYANHEVGTWIMDGVFNKWENEVGDWVVEMKSDYVRGGADSMPQPKYWNIVMKNNTIVYEIMNKDGSRRNTIPTQYNPANTENLHHPLNGLSCGPGLADMRFHPYGLMKDAVEGALMVHPGDMADDVTEFMALHCPTGNDVRMVAKWFDQTYAMCAENTADSVEVNVFRSGWRAKVKALANAPRHEIEMPEGYEMLGCTAGQPLSLEHTLQKHQERSLKGLKRALGTDNKPEYPMKTFNPRIHVPKPERRLGVSSTLADLAEMVGAEEPFNSAYDNAQLILFCADWVLMMVHNGLNIINWDNTRTASENLRGQIEETFIMYDDDWKGLDEDDEQRWQDYSQEKRERIHFSGSFLSICDAKSHPGNTSHHPFDPNDELHYKTDIKWAPHEVEGEIVRDVAYSFGTGSNSASQASHAREANEKILTGMLADNGAHLDCYFIHGLGHSHHYGGDDELDSAESWVGEGYWRAYSNVPDAQGRGEKSFETDEEKFPFSFWEGGQYPNGGYSVLDWNDVVAPSYEYGTLLGAATNYALDENIETMDILTDISFLGGSTELVMWGSTYDDRAWITAMPVSRYNGDASGTTTRLWVDDTGGYQWDFARLDPTGVGNKTPFPKHDSMTVIRERDFVNRQKTDYCLRLRFFDSDTQNVGWSNKMIREEYCYFTHYDEFSSVPSQPLQGNKNKLVFGHSMGGLISAGAYATKLCTLNSKDGRYVASQWRSPPGFVYPNREPENDGRTVFALTESPMYGARSAEVGATKCVLNGLLDKYFAADGGACIEGAGITDRFGADLDFNNDDYTSVDRYGKPYIMWTKRAISTLFTGDCYSGDHHTYMGKMSVGGSVPKGRNGAFDLKEYEHTTSAFSGYAPFEAGDAGLTTDAWPNVESRLMCIEAWQHPGMDFNARVYTGPGSGFTGHFENEGSNDQTWFPYYDITVSNPTVADKCSAADFWNSFESGGWGCGGGQYAIKPRSYQLHLLDFEDDKRHKFQDADTDGLKPLGAAFHDDMWKRDVRYLHAELVTMGDPKGDGIPPNLRVAGYGVPNWAQWHGGHGLLGTWYEGTSGIPHMPEQSPANQVVDMTPGFAYKSQGGDWAPDFRLCGTDWQGLMVDIKKYFAYMVVHFAGGMEKAPVNYCIQYDYDVCGHWGFCHGKVQYCTTVCRQENRCFNAMNDMGMHDGCVDLHSCMFGGGQITTMQINHADGTGEFADVPTNLHMQPGRWFEEIAIWANGRSNDAYEGHHIGGELLYNRWRYPTGRIANYQAVTFPFGTKPNTWSPTSTPTWSPTQAPTLSTNEPTFSPTLAPTYALLPPFPNTGADKSVRNQLNGLPKSEAVPQELCGLRDGVVPNNPNRLAIWLHTCEMMSETNCKWITSMQSDAYALARGTPCEWRAPPTCDWGRSLSYTCPPNWNVRWTHSPTLNPTTHRPTAMWEVRIGAPKTDTWRARVVSSTLENEGYGPVDAARMSEEDLNGQNLNLGGMGNMGTLQQYQNQNGGGGGGGGLGGGNGGGEPEQSEEEMESNPVPTDTGDDEEEEEFGGEEDNSGQKEGGNKGNGKGDGNRHPDLNGHEGNGDREQGGGGDDNDNHRMEGDDGRSGDKEGPGPGVHAMFASTVNGFAANVGGIAGGLF